MNAASATRKPEADASPNDPTETTGMGADRKWSLLLLVGILVALMVGYGLGRWSGTDSGDARSEALPGMDMSLLALNATEIEIGFLQDMSDHHGQAVLMSNVVLRHGENEVVRQIALNISSSQAYERGLMAAFLTDRNATAGAPDRLTMQWMGMGVPLDQMVGWVSSDDLAAFQNLRGADLDRRFLELMIVHHEGGVEMARAATEVLQDSAILDLAFNMISVQSREISDMQLMVG